jgi:Bacterial Ig-like domain
MKRFHAEGARDRMRVQRNLLTACLLFAAVPATRVSAGSTVAVMHGAHYGSRIFPDNAFTVADASQATGRRINFRQGIDYPNVGGVLQPSCTNADYSICDGFAQLNKLDGFDLQPRVIVPFTGAIDLTSVNSSNFFITTRRRAFVTGFRQLTFDPATNTLAGIADAFLAENTSYRIRVTNGILDTTGHRIRACGRRCTARFTTRTASGELVRIRESMDLPLSDAANA